MTASNPLSTQDDVCAAMVSRGLLVFARHGAEAAEYSLCHQKALDQAPNLIIDDGGDMLALLHSEYRQLIPQVIGGCEETTTGLQRLRAMEKASALEVPVFAVNDAQMKYLFDNRYGTGQSVWDSIMNTTNLVIAGKTVVVAGYGWCGKGTALRAKGLGAKLIITEIDPIKANEAWLDGFQVMPMNQAAALGDMFITVTGVKDVIAEADFLKMKDGAIMANAGHFDVEISKTDLNRISQSQHQVKPNIREYRLQDQKRLYLLGEGRLVNLAAGNGHPAEVMDTSFAAQALALQYLTEHRATIKPGLQRVPDEIDRLIAETRLAALNIKIDTLSPEQVKYQESWALE
jgi:adenosylhomocysteinase